MKNYNNHNQPEGVDTDGTRNPNGVNFPGGKFDGTKVIAGITAQSDLSLGYITTIVNNLVTDVALAKSVNDAITAKLTAQKAAFTKAVTDEYSDNCTCDDFTVDLTA